MLVHELLSPASMRETHRAYILACVRAGASEWNGYFTHQYDEGTLVQDALEYGFIELEPDGYYLKHEYMLWAPIFKIYVSVDHHCLVFSACYIYDPHGVGQVKVQSDLAEQISNVFGRNVLENFNPHHFKADANDHVVYEEGRYSITGYWGRTMRSSYSNELPTIAQDLDKREEFMSLW